MRRVQATQGGGANCEEPQAEQPGNARQNTAPLCCLCQQTRLLQTSIGPQGARPSRGCIQSDPLSPKNTAAVGQSLTSSASPAAMLMAAPSSQTLVRGSASPAFLNSSIITRTSPTLPPGGGGVKRGAMTTQRSLEV